MARIGEMSNYLSSALEALSKSSGAEDLKARLIGVFPDFAGRVLLDHQTRFLFPAPHGTA
jgi:hypothetical protein